MVSEAQVPVAVFFFPKAPEVPPIEQSFRTLTAADFAAIPRTVRYFLRRGQAMQLNLAELNDSKNPAGRLISRDLKPSTSTSLDQVAAQVREYLGVSIDEQASWKNAEDAFEKWREVFATKAGVRCLTSASISRFRFLTLKVSWRAKAGCSNRQIAAYRTDT